MVDNSISNNSLVYNYDENLKCIEDSFYDCPDVVRRTINLKNHQRGCLFYVRGLVNTDLIQRDFINHVLSFDHFDITEMKNIENHMPVARISYISTVQEAINDILSGNTVFICENSNIAISCELKKFEKRSIEEPVTEKNVRGSHEGFIEDISTNMSILRRKIKNNNLKFKKFKIGASTHQTVAIAYIDNIANKELLQKLYDKISTLDYDGYIGIGYIEQMITDNKKSVFPQYQATERPDKATAALLEGRFVIMLEGTPVVLVVPISFFSLLEAPDDYNSHWIPGSFIVILRLNAVLIAIFLPGMYIAILTYHYYIVPMNLLVPIAQSRTQVPFPPVIEAFLMELVLELLREASIRLPTYIGSTIGVVGGLIIGQAAVEANIVSNLMVIVVAVTAIASFVMVNYDMGLAIRMLRFIVMIAAAVFGIVGLIVCMILIISHLMSLDSLGQPYLQPIEPLKVRDLKDTVIRSPFKYQKYRPDIAKPKDKKRGQKDE